MTGSRETIFIGDIHGQASTLIRLLDKLGCRTRGGRLRAPEGAKLVFVGDLIDAGDENLRTVEIVRGLVEQGDALCLMGNHEYNAVQFHTEDPDRPGQYLREHSDKNVGQHEKVLEELANRPGDQADMLDWFKSLPLAAEGSNWRCVHACWHTGSLDALEHHVGHWLIPPERWAQAARPDQPEYAAVENLLKGPEYELPGNASFLDKYGNPRRRARIRWWEPNPGTLSEALLVPRPQPGIDLNAAYVNPDHPGYAAHAPLVFFGHYWKPGSKRVDLAPERPNAACVDYSAGRGETLAAYRLGGERILQAERYVTEHVSG